MHITVCGMRPRTWDNSSHGLTISSLASATAKLEGGRRRGATNLTRAIYIIYVIAHRRQLYTVLKGPHALTYAIGSSAIVAPKQRQRRHKVVCAKQTHGNCVDVFANNGNGKAYDDSHRMEIEHLRSGSTKMRPNEGPANAYTKIAREGEKERGKWTENNTVKHGKYFSFSRFVCLSDLACMAWICFGELSFLFWKKQICRTAKQNGERQSRMLNIQCKSHASQKKNFFRQKRKKSH